MKKCWDEDPLKRPSSRTVSNIIKNWIIIPYGKKVEDIDKELKCHSDLDTESHPQAYYTSRLLDFTSKKLNEILESECLDCIVNETNSLGM
jgi:hypothetical protein